ncbi:uncharacterized protein zgc:194621 [Esox lucius]|uniref:Uncharacterized protein n=2 Tax=Esox lucius TaxID=8010 RepID=A0A3P8ZX87_ESOLU|nr:uncharacterized protein zgc:194621 [Esox lucius]XP_010888425.1 uncharacterized protein zgc:194621 [Esox lucius]
MPTTRVIKQKPVETKTTVVEVKAKPVEKKPATISQLKVTPRKTRASSCPRCIHRNHCEVTKTQQGTVCSTGCERRARSTSTAPKTTLSSKSAVLCQNPSSPKSRATSKCDKPAQLGQKEERISRQRAPYAIQSHRAFTVIPPNPKKRTEIQQKAEAELAALEDLRLSRAMPYVSIDPSSVGGCLSLEEVRLKQQQEMQARRRQRQMKKYMLEKPPVVLG